MPTTNITKLVSVGAIAPWRKVRTGPCKLDSNGNSVGSSVLAIFG